MSAALSRSSVSGLVKSNRPATGQGQAGQKTPTFINHFSDDHPFVAQLASCFFNVITHQIQLMTATGLSRVTGHLRRRQSEDQPTVASIHMIEPKNVLEKVAISVSIFRVNHDMSPIEHITSSLLCAATHTTYPGNRP